jgi:hypothetical protein
VYAPTAISPDTPVGISIMINLYSSIDHCLPHHVCSGAPGMIGALMGGYVALTEQPELIRFIDMNIRHNFPPTQVRTKIKQLKHRVGHF